MSLHSNTLAQFWANECLLLLLKAVCLVQKQQIYQFYSLIWHDRCLSWYCSYGSWIYNNLCNQCPSPLKLRVWILLRQGLFYATYVIKSVSDLQHVGGIFCIAPPIKKCISEILLKVALNIITLTECSNGSTHNLPHLNQYLKVESIFRVGFSLGHTNS